MTKPPCYIDGKDCPRRYVGCKAECNDWHEWLAIHESETSAIRKQKQSEIEANDFLSGQSKRVWRRHHAHAKR